MNKQQNTSSENFENSLERLLTQASHSEGVRPHFYKELLESVVYICPVGPITTSEESADHHTVNLAAIIHEGVNYIPFYSSPQKVPRKTGAVQIPSRAFFEMTKGSHTILNPGSTTCKAFTPDEIGRLLSGVLFSAETEIQVRNDSKIIIGKPMVIPDKLIDQLSKFFAENIKVKRAWLAWYHNPSQAEKPGYLLVIDVHNGTDFKNLAGMTTAVLNEVGLGNAYCDIGQYTGNGLTSYFRFRRPFYSVSFLRRVLGKLF